MPEPTQPAECRENAEAALAATAAAGQEPGPLDAVAWALLAVAGELHEIRRLLHKRR